MPRGRAAFGATAVALVVATIGAACTVGPSNRPAVVHDGDAPPVVAPTPGKPPPAAVRPLGAPEGAKLSWSDCTSQTRFRLGAAAGTAMRFECARVSNTLDSPSRPGRGTTRIAVLKAGTGPVPLVVVNDVNGEPGTLFAARLAQQLGPEVMGTFSLVGVDRRGTGESEHLQCVPESIRQRLIGFDPTAKDSTKINELLEVAREASQECMLDLDEQLPANDTWRTASDLEKVRELLGMRHLHALGSGEGSRVLTVYAERYGDKAGRFVLDGSPDPTSDGIGLAQARAAATEATFSEFADDCVKRGCSLGSDPKKSVNDLVAKLAEKSLTSSDGLAVTGGSVMFALTESLGERSSWPALGDALAKAASGDAGPVAALLAPVIKNKSTVGARFDGSMITACNDTTVRIPPDRAAQLIKEWGAKSPLFGPVFSQRLMWCGPWPVPSQPLPPVRGANAGPMVVLTTATDPMTPPEGTKRTAEQLPGASLVTWQSNGHGALTGSGCVATALKDYLVDGKMPANATVCPP
ncbi:alpha/beta hydrolase [Allokutzneria multivorans]|uniref:Alpha/beta hydrolase n=1 Tax=Allokutzneria multivorans TaxID=1142134 RepID=A0ABP7TDY1_9PSEU